MIVVTASGQRLDLFEPDRGAIRLRDIADHLAKIAPHPAAHNYYSLAQRACLMADGALLDGLGPDAGLHALIYFAPSAFLVGSPISPAEDPATGIPYIKGRAILISTISAALDLDYPSPHQAKLDHIALRCRLSELRQLRTGCEEQACALEQSGVRPLTRAIRPWSWDMAAEKYLKAWSSLAAAASCPRDHARVH